jgi:lipopolysaccharide transport system permease protein
VSLAYVVEPRSGWQAFNLAELLRYRELLYFLTWRDIKVRYKQTAIGAAWAILQPLLTMVAFALIFGRFIGVSSDGVPYPLFTYVALVPWTFFATSINRSGASLVAEAHVISKVYFPRLLVPLSAVLAITVDLAIACVILVGMLAWYGIVPGPALLALPPLLVLLVLASFGIGLWLSALNVKYRDVAHIIPFLTQFGLLLTPVAYASSVVPEQWRVVYALNPMVGVIEGLRWALLGTPTPPYALMFVSVAVSLATFGAGLVYFHRMEDQFADIV